MRYVPQSSVPEASLRHRHETSTPERNPRGLRWLGWLLRLVLACAAVLAIGTAVHRLPAHSDWKDALMSIPLRDDAFIGGHLGDFPMVGIDAMPIRVFGIEWLPSQVGATSGEELATDEHSTTDWVSVSLPYSETNDDHLRLIAQQPRIRALSLDGTRITDAGLKHLRGMAHLETLSLGATEISDAGARVLSEVRSLRYLDLRRTRLTNAALASLAELRQLESLNLSGTGVDGSGFVHLNRLTSLHTLVLTDVVLEDRDVEALLTLVSLREMHLHGTRLSEAGIARLALLPALEVCDIDGARLSRRDLDALRRRAGN